MLKLKIQKESNVNGEIEIGNFSDNAKDFLIQYFMVKSEDNISLTVPTVEYILEYELPVQPSINILSFFIDFNSEFTQKDISLLVSGIRMGRDFLDGIKEKSLTLSGISKVILRMNQILKGKFIKNPPAYLLSESDYECLDESEGVMFKNIFKNLDLNGCPLNSILIVLSYFLDRSGMDTNNDIHNYCFIENIRKSLIYGINEYSLMRIQLKKVVELANFFEVEEIVFESVFE